MNMKIIGAGLILLLSNVVNAAGWTNELSIDSAFAEDSDLLIVYTRGDAGTLAGGAYATGCSTGAWHISASTDARRARLWATVLTAQATGKKIKFWFTDACGSWGYHKATALMLVK